MSSTARARGNASEWALPRFFYGCFYALGGGFSKLHYRFFAEGFMRFSPLCGLVPGFTWQLSLGWKLLSLLVAWNEILIGSLMLSPRAELGGGLAMLMHLGILATDLMQLVPGLGCHNWNLKLILFNAGLIMSVYVLYVHPAARREPPVVPTVIKRVRQGDLVLGCTAVVALLSCGCADSNHCPPCSRRPLRVWLCRMTHL